MLRLDAMEAKRLVEKYRLVGELNPEQRYTSLLSLSTDLIFYFPVLKVAEGWSAKKSSRFLGIR